MQSEVIASRELLEAKLMALHEQYKDKPPQRPAHWGGFLVRPNEIEFGKDAPIVCTTACILCFKIMIGWGNDCLLNKRYVLNWSTRE